MIEPSRLGELRVVAAVAAADGTWLGTDGEAPRSDGRGDEATAKGAATPARDRAAARHVAARAGRTLPGRGGETLVGGSEAAVRAPASPAMPESARGTLLGTTGSTELRDKLGIPAAEGAPAEPSKAAQRTPVPWRSRLALSQDEASLLREQLGIPALESSDSGRPKAGLKDVSATASLSDDEAVALRAKLALPFPAPKTRPARSVPLRPVYIPGAPWCQEIDAPPTSIDGEPPDLGPTPAPPTLPGYDPSPGDSDEGVDG